MNTDISNNIGDIVIVKDYDSSCMEGWSDNMKCWSGSKCRVTRISHQSNGKKREYSLLKLKDGEKIDGFYENEIDLIKVSDGWDA